MQGIKITKEYTFEEIKEDFKDKIKAVCKELDALSKDVNAVCNSLDLKVVSMANFNDNINVSRRNLVMIDQLLSDIVSSVETISQAAQENHESPVEVQEDDQAG